MACVIKESERIETKRSLWSLWGGDHLFRDNGLCDADNVGLVERGLGLTGGNVHLCGQCLLLVLCLLSINRRSGILVSG